MFVEKKQSKSSLSYAMETTKSLLPSPNAMPVSYDHVRNLLSDELIMLEKIHVCVNDCIMYRQQNVDLARCPICGEKRYKAVDSLGRLYPRRIYNYAPLEQSLKFMFGCANIAQVMQTAGGATVSPNLMTDISESDKWAEWTSPEGDATKVILGLNTDGVNPFHSQGIQYSLWPIILCVFNLPKHVRNKSYAILLTGIVPSRKPRQHGGNLEPNLQIYTNLLVDDLLQLASTEIYSAYSEAPITVKVRLLVFMMDFQGYAKFFQMSGANSYFPCNICMIRSTRKADRDGSSHKMVILGHDVNATPTRNFAEEVRV